MTDVELSDVMSEGYPDLLSAEIDRVFARVTGARGMGALMSDAKPRLLAMVGPAPEGFSAVRAKFAYLALSTGAAGNTIATHDPGLGGAAEQVIATFAKQAADAVAPWDGNAAVGFDAFIKYFEAEGAAVTNLRLAIDYLHLAAEAQQQIYINSRTDLWNLVQAVDAAIDTSEDLSSTRISIALTVIAAVASAGATLAGGAVGAAVGWTMIASATSAAAPVIGAQTHQAKVAELDPTDKWTIRDSLLDTIGGMEADLAEAEEQARQGILGIAQAMDFYTGVGSTIVGPTVTGPDGKSVPIEWDLNGKGTLPQSFIDGFIPPSATE